MQKILFAAALAACPAAAPAGRTIDAADFGATAGDGADDAAAIQRALDAAAPGDVVRLGGGTFDLAGRLQMKSGVTLAGLGRDETRLARAGDARVSAMIDLTGTAGVTLIDFALDAANRPGVDNAIVGYAGPVSGGHRIERLAVRNLVAPAGRAGPDVFAYHGVFLDGHAHSVVRQSVFENIGAGAHWGAAVRINGSEVGGDRNGDGVVDSRDSDGGHALVENNVVRNTGRGGILLDGAPDSVVRGNTVSGSGLYAAFMADDADAVGLGIEVYGGGSEDAGADARSAARGRADRTVVENNRVDHWLSLDSGSRVAVRNNVVGGAMNDNGDTKFIGLEMAKSGHDNVFADNVVDGGQFIGLSVSNTGQKRHLAFVGNAIRGAEHFGVQLQGNQTDADPASRLDRVLFAGNTVAGTDAAGPNLDSAVFGAAGPGVRLLGGVYDVSFYDNTIVDNDAAGLMLGDVAAGGAAGEVDRLYVTGNRINGNAGPAIVVHFGVAPDENAAWPGDVLAFADNAHAGNAGDRGFAATPGAPARPDLGGHADRRVLVGETVQFVLAADLAEGGHVLWDFGDGLPTAGRAVAHAYDRPGTYRVTVALWDESGRADYARFNIFVAVPEPSGAALGGAALAGLALRHRQR